MSNTSAMSEEERDAGPDRDEFDEPFDDEDPQGPDVALQDLERELERVEAELYDVRGELSRFEQAVEDRTIKKPAVEANLRRYVRRRMRRTRARGWGPYIVLLYGTAMTIGGFYFLEGLWAILAMFVVWLSTLGLYVVMVAVGAVFNVLDVPGRAWDAFRSWRE